MSVVAEGVEMVDQHSELDASGCHSGQGYLYAYPCHRMPLLNGCAPAA
jgi:EAL domain-containing protein (putative c-di-GMP-specific phosphodiesterase class I)